MTIVANGFDRFEDYKLCDGVVFSTRISGAFVPICSLRFSGVGWAPRHHIKSFAIGLQGGFGPRMVLHHVFHMEKLKCYACCKGLLREIKPSAPMVVQDHLGNEVPGLLQREASGVPSSIGH